MTWQVKYKRKESGWHFLAQFSKGSICTGVLENVNNSENVNNYNKSDSELDVKVDAATTLFDPRFNTDSEDSDGLWTISHISKNNIGRAYKYF